MKYYIIILVVMSLTGCSGIDSAQQYIEQIQELKANNERLQNAIKSVQNEAEELRKKNMALEKMSEERIRKFWSMYETDA